MFDQPPRLIAPIGYGIAVAIAIELARRYPDYRSLCLCFALVLSIVALMTAANWTVYQATLRARAAIDARTETERVKILRAISGMTPDQTHYAESMNGYIVLLPGEPSPVLYYLGIGSERVPYEFIHQFVEYSGKEYLCPVGQFPDGSDRRKWSILLTNHLIMLGYAEKASGNRPAKWKDYKGAMRSLGLEEIAQPEVRYQLNTLDWLNRREAKTNHE
jgi:hypothetical protein